MSMFNGSFVKHNKGYRINIDMMIEIVFLFMIYFPKCCVI